MTGGDDLSADRWHLCEPTSGHEEAQMKRVTTTIEIKTVSLRGRLSVFARLAASAAVVLVSGRVDLVYTGNEKRR